MEKILRIAVLILGFLMIAMCVKAITQNKFSTLRAIDSSGQIVSAKERDRQLDCLARNIYHEAGHEPFEGKVAVAQVTINRSESGQFPKDICAVIYQKTVFLEKIVCQFSWYCETPGNTKLLQKPVYDESYEVAKKVLLEGFRLDGLKTAMYYHADYVNPQWNKPKLTKIGHHIFYQ